MILSVSRRTDIPAFYSEWFFQRLRAGYAYVRNPMNPHQISEVSLSPEAVDGVVFWTKNPAPMLSRLAELRDAPYYFQFTLTPYARDVEKNLPPKDELVATFRQLARSFGRERVVWRYDPILLSERYTTAYHVRAFRALCDELGEATEKCTISFLDMYRNIRARVTPLGIRAPEEGEMQELAERFGEIARAHGLGIDTCAEAMDLSRFGVGRAACIDVQRLERIGQCKLRTVRDRNQREACGCAASIDLGAYNTCRNGCCYCYANFNDALVRTRALQHDPASPLLCGRVEEGDVIRPRAMESLRERQISLFD